MLIKSAGTRQHQEKTQMILILGWSIVTGRSRAKKIHIISENENKSLHNFTFQDKEQGMET